MALGNITGCATTSGSSTGYSGSFEYKGKMYHGWQAFLLQKDLIRGPDLYVNRKMYRPMDFQAHLDQGENNGFGAVDYDVPVGTPVVPAFNGRIFKQSWGNGKYIRMVHAYLKRDPYYFTTYHHLSEQYRMLNQDVRLQHIIGLSGATMDPGVNQGPHLHFQIEKAIQGAKYTISPGINPFTTGIDGGRPTYWSGRSTDWAWVDQTVPIHKKRLETICENTPYYLDFEKLDNDMKNKLLELRKDPLMIRKFLAHEVLEKHPTPEGPKYKYDVDHFLYDLTFTIHAYSLGENKDKTGAFQDFLTSLPLIHPLRKDIYARANLDLKGLVL
jgi:hypothetical protein